MTERSFRFFKTCLVIAALIFPLLVNAQQVQDSTADKGFDKSKLFVGGSLGLSFGDYTYVTLSPMVGYRFKSWLSAGVNINAQYNSVKYYDVDNRPYRKEQYGLGGIGVFTRLYPIQQLFVHIQPEVNFISGKVKYYDGTASDSYTTHAPSLLLGAGYAQPTGSSSAFTLMILYDVLQNKYSPYGDQPIIRAGVDIGF